MTYSSKTDDLPVVVGGGGPIGLVAAAHLVDHGFASLVLEAGDGPGASMRAWGHVRVFSPWKYMVEGVSRRMLQKIGWRMPDPETLPTGDEFVRGFLEPLAALPKIQPYIRYNHRVVGVTRHGFDKVKTTGREAWPFEVVSQGPGGGEVRILARAVIDASGTYTTPNPLGSGGLPAEGERDASRNIVYGIPDVLARERKRYAGKRVLVIGSGHSAFTSLLDLAWLKTEEPNTEVIWATRRTEIGRLFGIDDRDALPARSDLGDKARQIVEHADTGSTIELAETNARRYLQDDRPPRTGARGGHRKAAEATTW